MQMKTREEIYQTNYSNYHMHVLQHQFRYITHFIAVIKKIKLNYIKNNVFQEENNINSNYGYQTGTNCEVIQSDVMSKSFCQIQYINKCNYCFLFGQLKRSVHMSKEGSQLSISSGCKSMRSPKCFKYN